MPSVTKTSATITPVTVAQTYRFVVGVDPQAATHSYAVLDAAGAVIARREGLGKETVRRWVVQAQIDGGQRQGATSEELAEIKDLKAKVRRLEEDNEILRRGGCRTNRPVRRCGWLAQAVESKYLERGLQLRCRRS